MGDVSLSGAGLAEVLKDQVGLQVEELEQAEQGCSAVIKSFRGPRGRGVLRVQVEIHCQEAEEAVVMETVFEHVREWHRSA